MLPWTVGTKLIRKGHKDWGVFTLVAYQWMPQISEYYLVLRLTDMEYTWPINAFELYKRTKNYPKVDI